MAPTAATTTITKSARSRVKYSHDIKLETEIWALRVSIAELKDRLLRSDQANNSLGIPPPSVIRWLDTQKSTKSEYVESLKLKHEHFVTQAQAHSPEAEQLRTQIKVEQDKLFAYEAVTKDITHDGDTSLMRTDGPDNAPREAMGATQSSESRKLDGSEQISAHKTDHGRAQDGSFIVEGLMNQVEHLKQYLETMVAQNDILENRLLEAISQQTPTPLNEEMQGIKHHLYEMQKCVTQLEQQRPQRATSPPVGMYV